MTDTQSNLSQPVKNFISIARAVQHSGYSEQYLRRLARRQVIQAVKFDHFWMIDQRSLQEYLDRAASKYEHDKRFGPREFED